MQNARVSICCPQVSDKKQGQLKSLSLLLSLALAVRELEQFKDQNHGLDFQEKQHVHSPPLTPKHKKIAFT